LIKLKQLTAVKARKELSLKLRPYASYGLLNGGKITKGGNPVKQKRNKKAKH
jgi:hypothetical protein